MCKRAARLLRKVLRKHIELVKDDPTGENKFYVLDIDTVYYVESVRAFKCPTEPPLYLEVHGPDEGAYITVYVIIEYDFVHEEDSVPKSSPSPLHSVRSEEASIPSSPSSAVEGVSSPHILSIENMNYVEKYVTDITEGKWDGFGNTFIKASFHNAINFLLQYRETYTSFIPQSTLMLFQKGNAFKCAKKLLKYSQIKNLI